MAVIGRAAMMTFAADLSSICDVVEVIEINGRLILPKSSAERSGCTLGPYRTQPFIDHT